MPASVHYLWICERKKTSVYQMQCGYGGRQGSLGLSRSCT